MTIDECRIIDVASLRRFEKKLSVRTIRQLSIQFCAKSAKYFSVSLYTLGIQAFTKINVGVNFLNGLKVKRSIVI